MKTRIKVGLTEAGDLYVKSISFSGLQSSNAFLKGIFDVNLLLMSDGSVDPCVTLRNCPEAGAVIHDPFTGEEFVVVVPESVQAAIKEMTDREEEEVERESHDDDPGEVEDDIELGEEVFDNAEADDEDVEYVEVEVEEGEEEEED